MNLCKRLILLAMIVVSTLNAASKQIPWDVASDKRILSVFQSTDFDNQLITYRYKGKSWPMRVIHCPNGERLTGGTLSLSSPYYFFTPMVLPQQLHDHIREVLKPYGSTFYGEGTMINGSTAFERFKNPIVIPKTVEEPKIQEPIAMPKAPEPPVAPPAPIAAPVVMTPPKVLPTATTIKDPIIDGEIEAILRSNELVNQEFKYELDGVVYRVRLVYNPAATPLVITKTFHSSLWPYKARPFTLNWNRKYGIMVDKSAPQALIDHITALLPLSWWDTLFSKDVQNGTLVEFKDGELTYTTISWFEFMAYAKQAS